MDRMERNFLRDQSGMRKQLLTLDHLVQLMDPKLYLHLQSADSTNFFFFFRMLLVWYKREFQWGDVLHLWEVLWTDFLSSGFHLFIALAILEKHRTVIMEHLKHFDEVLKYSTSFLSRLQFEIKHANDRSKRTLHINRPREHARPSRSPLSAFPAHRRSNRQEIELPGPIASSTATCSQCLHRRRAIPDFAHIPNAKNGTRTFKCKLERHLDCYCGQYEQWQCGCG
jgi:hypothetical protein